MGSFMGHAIPGSFFIIFSSWWMVSIFRRYFESKFSKKKFHNSSSYRCQCIPNLPFEAFIKLFLISVGIAGEVVTGFRNWKFVHIGNGQHITMYAFFIFNAAADIVYFYSPGLLPEHLDYLSAAMAFSVQGILFSWHLHGREMIDVQVHTFLFYAIVLTVIFTMLEAFNRDKAMYGLGRALGTLVQGTWFWQIGFSIHNPLGESVENSHHEMMMMTMKFCWHIGANIVYMGIAGMFVYYSVKRQYPDVIIQSRNIRGETVCLSISDTEEETLLITQDGNYTKVPTSETM